MSVGRIDFLDKNGEVKSVTEYESWDKMKAQIALEDQFGDPFIAQVYSYDKLPFELKAPNSKVRYLQDLVPDDAENDRFWVEENEIVAVYWNPNGGPDGFGDYLEHHFSFESILECNKDAGNDKQFSDLLYGNATYDTFCLDIGTREFEEMSKDFSSGFRPNDNSFTGIREWMVRVAKEKLSEKGYFIRESKISPVLYLQMKNGETAENALDRVMSLLDQAGFDVLSGSLDKYEIQEE